MHPSALRNCQSFFDTYAMYFASQTQTRVIEIGSQDVNGSLRSTSPTSFEYIGVDFQAAKGVDVVLDDPYVLPFHTGTADIVLTSSCFEHSEMFWLVFLEIMRILKPGGLLYMNAPSTGSFHRYPVDCWRFYPDSGAALAKWARRNGMNVALLETYTQMGGVWQDHVSVFLRDDALLRKYPGRILDGKKDYENGQLHGDSRVLNLASSCQNDRKLQVIGQVVSEQVVVN